MSRYRENIYKQELESSIVALNDIVDLVNEVKRKTTSKSAHKVLDNILSICKKRENGANSILNKLKGDI